MASAISVSGVYRRQRLHRCEFFLTLLIFVSGYCLELQPAQLDERVRGDNAHNVTRSRSTTIPTTGAPVSTTISPHRDACSPSSSSSSCINSTFETTITSLHGNGISRPYLTTSDPEEIPLFDWSEIFHEAPAHQICSRAGLCSLQYPVTYSNLTDDERVHWNISLVIVPNDLSDLSFLETPCFCDPECVRYGDCCQDAARLWWGSGPEDESLYMQCLPLRRPESSNETRDLLSVYMISRCPASWTELGVIERCKRGVPVNEYHYLLDVPVLSLESNRTYANIYCARCHSETRLAKWTAEIACNNREIQDLQLSAVMAGAQYFPGSLKWTYRMNASGAQFLQNVDCYLLIAQLKNVNQYIKETNGRRCIPRVDQCPEWSKREDARKCEMYSLMVEGTKPAGSVYKNPHCLRCNTGRNFSVESAKCSQRRLPSKGMKTQFASLPPPSFALLLDFTPGAGGRPGLIRKCQVNEFWDDIHEKCHPVTCGSLYEFVNNTCVRRHGEPPIDSNSTIIDSSCPRVTLAFNEVAFMNTTLLVSATQKQYNAGQYEIINSTVQVCHQDIKDHYFRYSEAQNYLSGICLAISLICLAAHIIIHAALPKLRNLPGKNLLSLACTLFMGQLFFLAGVDQTSNRGACTFVGIAIHWFYLASFFWMNVMSFDICRTFTGGRHRFDRGQVTFRYYSLYAWGMPTFLVTLCLILDNSTLLPDYAPHYGVDLCWISNQNGLIIFFVVPVSLLLLENFILFVLTVRGIYQQRKAARFIAEKNRAEKSKRRARPENPCELKLSNGAVRKHTVRLVLYVKLALIMGLGWIFGFVAALVQVPGLWYPFILFNGLQGAFIFLAFDVKRKVFFLIWELMTGKPHRAALRSSTSQQSSSTGTRTTTSNLGNDMQLPTKRTTSASRSKGASKTPTTSVRSSNGPGFTD